jgi:hypothetical protein
VMPKEAREDETDAGGGGGVKERDRRKQDGIPYSGSEGRTVPPASE